LAAWEFAQTPLGSLQVTALPYLLAGLRDLLLRKGKRRGGKGREEDERGIEGRDGRGGEGLWTLTMLETY